MASRPVLAPVVAAVALVVGGGYLTLSFSRAAQDFFPAVNESKPALAETEPTLSSPGPRLANRVIIVIVDGLRLRDSFGYPTLDRLRRAGIDARASSHYPTISRPNHVAVVTGVPPTASGVRNNFYRGVVEIDSLMDRVAKDHGSSAFVGDYASGLAYMLTDDFAELTYAPWPGGFVKAARIALERDHRLVVLLPGSIDEAGHAHGADSIEYRDSIRFVDRQLAVIADVLDFGHDALIIVADHGHTDSGGHGGNEADVVQVPLIMVGAGIRQGAAVTDARLIDIAPTAAALLGVSAPGHSLGRTLIEALEIDAMEKQIIIANDQLRVAANTKTVEIAIAASSVAQASIRVGRLIMVLGIFIVGVSVFLLVGRKLGAVRLDWRILVIGVPAFPLTYYAILDMFGQSISLSALPDRGDAVMMLFRFGLVSTGVMWLAGLVAMRGRVVLRDRLAAANALTISGTLVAYLPAGVMWALFGSPPFTVPPSSALMILVPATYIAVACYTLGAAITLGLEIIIFFARAVDPRLRQRGKVPTEAP